MIRNVDIAVVSAKKIAPIGTAALVKITRWTLKFSQTLLETLIEQTLEFCIGKEIQIRQRAAPGIGILIGKIATMGLQFIYSKSSIECFAIGRYDALVQSWINRRTAVEQVEGLPHKLRGKSSGGEIPLAGAILTKTPIPVLNTAPEVESSLKTLAQVGLCVKHIPGAVSAKKESQRENIFHNPRIVRFVILRISPDRNIDEPAIGTVHFNSVGNPMKMRQVIGQIEFIIGKISG